MSMQKGGRPEDEHEARCDARRSGWADVGPLAANHGQSGRFGLRIALVLGPLHVNSGLAPWRARDEGGVDAYRRGDNTAAVWIARVPDDVSTSIPPGADGRGR